VEADHFYLKFWVKLTLLERKGRFSNLTPSEKSSINANRKSAFRFPIRWTSYVALSP